MKALVPVLAGIGMITSVISMNLWRELHASRQANIEMHARLKDDTSAVLVAAPAPNASPVPSTPAATPNSTVTAGAAACKPAQPVVAREVDYDHLERELLKDPEYRKLRVTEQRSNMDRNFPGLAEELGLSEGEAAGFFDLLAEHDVALQTEWLVYRTTPNPDQATLEEMNRRQETLQRQQDESRRAMLGDKYPQWQEYQGNRGARNQITSLSQQLAQAGVPLNEAQTRSLTATLISEQQRKRQTTGRTPARDIPDSSDPGYNARILAQQTKLAEESNRRIIDAAAPVMSARQLAVLKEQLKQQAGMSRISLQLQLERDRLLSSQSTTR